MNLCFWIMLRLEADRFLICEVRLVPKTRWKHSKMSAKMGDVADRHVFDYRGLWKLLIDVGLSRGELQAGTGLSNNVMSRLTRGEGVSLETLARICDYLECELADLQIGVLSVDDAI